MATFLTADGTELFYERHGSGRRVYAMSGGPANDLRSLVDDLEPLFGEFEIVFHDYRGSGRSASAPPETYRLERLADDLDELRSELGDEEIVVVGFSMGSFVALQYALRHPDRCGRIVLAGSYPSLDVRKWMRPTVRALGWVRSITMVARAVWWLLAFSWQPPSEERQWRLYAIWATLQEGLPEARARQIARERALGLPLANDNIEEIQRRSFRTFDVIEDLPAITCPVLVLYGDRDAMAVWGASVFRRQLPGVGIEAFAGIGHDLFFEAPNPTCDAVRSFVNA